MFNVPSTDSADAHQCGAATTTIANVSVDELANLGSESSDSERRASFEERKLEPGEAKTKLAFLNFSSGTTGKPKVSSFSSSSTSVQCA